MRLSRILLPVVAMSALATQAGAKVLTSRQLEKQCKGVSGQLRDTYETLGKSLNAMEQHGLHTHRGIDAAGAGGEAWGKAVVQYAGFLQNLGDSERSLVREAGKSTSRIPEMHQCLTEELNPALNKAEKRFNQLVDKLGKEAEAKKAKQKPSVEKPAPELSRAPGVNKTQNSPFRVFHEEF